MTTLCFETGSEAYPALARYVLARGSHVEPHGLPCVELVDTCIVVNDASRAVPVASGRNLRTSIGATEYAQLLAGVSWLEQLDLASGGRFAQFANDQRLRGAYGPRTYRQLPWVADKLWRDPDSRQAVAVISRGVFDDAADGQRDVPCTIGLQFRIRNQKLTTTVMMRSSDLFLGVPYDWWMFSRLGMTLAWALGVPTGAFTFFAGSLHVYERDVMKADALRWAPNGVEEQPPAITVNYYSDVGNAPRRLRDAQEAAEKVVLGSNVDRVVYPGTSWYSRHVPVPEGQSWLCNRCRYVSRSYACEACGFPQVTFDASQGDLVTEVTGIGKEARQEE